MKSHSQLRYHSVLYDSHSYLQHIFCKNSFLDACWGQWFAMGTVVPSAHLYTHSTYKEKCPLWEWNLNSKCMQG